MARIEQIIKMLMTQNLSSHEELVAETTAHTCMLVYSIRLLQDKKMAVVDKVEPA